MKKLTAVKFDDKRMTTLMALAITSVKVKCCTSREAVNKIDNILYQYDLKLTRAQKQSLANTIEVMSSATL